jgi:hypothetical protein
MFKSTTLAGQLVELYSTVPAAQRGLLSFIPGGEACRGD